jgi:translocation protein SEC63
VKTQSKAELAELETVIKEQLGAKWTEVRKLAQDYSGELHGSRRKALVLLYAHLLRLEVKSAALKKRATITCVQCLRC